MPYTIRKQKCKQSDGDAGSYVLSYTDKSGKKHSNCHTSKKKAQGQIAAIEGQWEADEVGAEEEVMTERLLREMVRELLNENANKVIDIYNRLVADRYRDGNVPVEEIENELFQDGLDDVVDQNDPKLTKDFDFYINAKTKEYMMVAKESESLSAAALDDKGESEENKKSPGARGFAYEATLINALEAGGIPTADAAGNNSSISDLGFEVNGVKIGSEVKLSHKDNLGAIRKENFEYLMWDGSNITGAPSANSKMPDMINALIASMNKSAKVKSRFKELEKYIVQFRPLPWDLLRSFGSDKGGKTEAILYGVLRNDPERFPLPRGVEPVPFKQIATPGDGVANIDQSTLLAIMSGKSAPNGADTAYVIVGYGPGSESKVAGQIYSLGSDPLNIGAPLYAPGSIGVDIRFAGAGGSSTSRRFSFNFKTKAISKPEPGIPFNSSEELISILTKGKPVKENLIREYARSTLCGFKKTI